GPVTIRFASGESLHHVPCARWDRTAISCPVCALHRRSPRLFIVASSAPSGESAASNAPLCKSEPVSSPTSQSFSVLSEEQDRIRAPSAEKAQAEIGPL